MVDDAFCKNRHNSYWKKTLSPRKLDKPASPIQSIIIENPYFAFLLKKSLAGLFFLTRTGFDLEHVIPPYKPLLLHRSTTRGRAGCSSSRGTGRYPTQTVAGHSQFLQVICHEKQEFIKQQDHLRNHPSFALWWVSFVALVMFFFY